LDGNKIYVLGKVQRPGEFPMNRQTDIMQALALAGGLNQFAAENKIVVLRRDSNGVQKAIPFEYGEVKGGDELQTNILLQSGDVVVVR
jgi:polysaccharide export outer membrane protein